MLYRKIGHYIEDHFKADSDKILILEGARQIGKSYIIRSIELCAFFEPSLRRLSITHENTALDLTRFFFGTASGTASFKKIAKKIPFFSFV